MGHFCNFWTSVTLTLTLDCVMQHNIMYHSSFSIYIPGTRFRLHISDSDVGLKEEKLEGWRVSVGIK